MPAKKLSIWLHDGREIVCPVVCITRKKHPVRKNNRIGMACRVVHLKNHKGSKNFVHVYFESEEFDGPCFFYLKNNWWESAVPIKQSISLQPDQGHKLRMELHDLEVKANHMARRIAGLRRELDGD